MAIMIINVSLGVFYRYVLNNSLSWTEEMARYLMIWFAFLGMSLALKEEMHVGINVIIDLLPDKIRLLFKMLGNLLVMVFLLFLLRYSINHLRIVRIQTSPALGIKMIWAYISVTVGTVLMILEALKLICRNISGLKKG
jgi:TRAP-type C4-dicarboxylate transport system permease small subunit